ncbi:hypothetical protein INR49_024527 [Caranx melampygus]|nr:hypothetical protein INR49_024527 [Caranx melampygus]
MPGAISKDDDPWLEWAGASSCKSVEGGRRRGGEGGGVEELLLGPRFSVSRGVQVNFVGHGGQGPGVEGLDKCDCTHSNGCTEGNLTQPASPLPG